MITAREIQFTSQATALGQEITGDHRIRSRAIIDYSKEQQLDQVRHCRERITRNIMFWLYGRHIHILKDVAQLIQDPGDKQWALDQIRELQEREML